MSKREITLNVNGADYNLFIEEDALLVDVLRQQIGLTGTKVGCGEGECGACTVLLDGQTVNSCLTLAVRAQGKTILTIEGLSCDGQLDAIQEAFIEAGAIQCGFCTPGVVLSAKSLLDRYEDPDEETVKEELSGHLCRCTGYLQFFDAIKIAVQKRREG